MCGSEEEKMSEQHGGHATGPVDRLFGALAAAVTGRWGRWITLAVWIVAAGLLSVVAPKVADYYDVSGFGIGDQESVRAAKIVTDSFPSARGLPAIIVVHNPAGLSAGDEAAAQQISDWLVGGSKIARIEAVVSPYTVPQVRGQLVSADGTTMEIVASLAPPTSTGSQTETVKALRAYTDGFDNQAGRQVKVTGPAGIITDAAAIFGETDFTLLLTTVILVLVLLLAIYRSPILALTPLVAVGVATAVVNPLIGYAAKAGLFPVSQQAASILTILLFGAGTDYTIFLAARYREELEREPDRILALRRAVVGVGEAITSSAGTVIVALLTLLLENGDPFRAGWATGGCNARRWRIGLAGSARHRGICTGGAIYLARWLGGAFQCDTRERSLWRPGPGHRRPIARGGANGNAVYVG
jgi:RND superfamily putative drug exporter